MGFSWLGLNDDALSICLCTAYGKKRVSVAFIEKMISMGIKIERRWRDDKKFVGCHLNELKDYNLVAGF